MDRRTDKHVKLVSSYEARSRSQCPKRRPTPKIQIPSEKLQERREHSLLTVPL
jgi:hypothetical protein